MPIIEHPGDTQVVELLVRNRLVDELLRARLEVAHELGVTDARPIVAHH